MIEDVLDEHNRQWYTEYLSCLERAEMEYADDYGRS